MKVIFYDRKNKREVSSDKLFSVEILQNYAGVENEGFGSGSPVQDLTDKYGKQHLFIAEEIIGQIGYKTESCPSYMNFDMWCMESDLLFLRLEDE